MTTDVEQQRAAERILGDESLISNLQDNEAKVLIDWALSELEAGAANGLQAQSVSLDERVVRVRTAMKEIAELVGNKQTLVSDDLEERMAALLVGDLDPGSQVRLQIEREVAQVTAEKDHLDKVELVKQFTLLTSQAWESKRAEIAAPLHAPRAAATAQVKIQAADASVLQEAHNPQAASAPSRPIPRPTPLPEKKPGRLARLFGWK